jgi:SAM-dependent methyltransferase
MSTGTEDYYRERAPEYDRVYLKPERQTDLRSMESWLPRRLRDRRVLEIAAGTGYWTNVIADVAATVVATDVNDATLAVARCQRKWPSSVRFAEQDAFDLESIEGEFDAALVGFFWSHVELGDLDRFLNGLRQRLGPGAIAVFLDNRYVEGSNHPVTRTDEKGNTYQSRALSDGSKWEVLKNFPTVSELRWRLAAVSSRIEIHEWPYYWAATCTLR